MKIRKLQLAILAASLAGAMSANAALTWNFENVGDYYASGNATVSVGQGTVPAQAVDEAAILAKINTQAYHLNVGDITGGGYTINSFSTDPPRTPSIVYGTLYLSPTGGGGSTVMINMSPMSYTGTGGNLIYTFGLDTPADVKIKNGAGGTWGVAEYTGNFGGAIDWVEASVYSGTYAAFFGPQIGMSGTSNTAFNVSEIQLELAPVPEPTTMIAGALLLLPFGASTLRLLRKSRTV